MVPLLHPVCPFDYGQIEIREFQRSLQTLASFSGLLADVGFCGKTSSALTITESIGWTAFTIT
jgi:hypothetical protein